MNVAGLVTGGVIEAVGKVADDLFTSDEERAAAELENRKLDTQLMLGQQDINKAEAQSASLFVAGWRPAVGWVCALALGLIYIPRALVMASLWAYQAWVIVAGWNGAGAMPALPPYPDLGVADLIGLLLAMLGMAGLRTKETLEGRARAEPLSKFELPNPFRRKGAGDQEAP